MNPRWRQWAPLIGILLLAAALRGFHLDYPDCYCFDEVYYVEAAAAYVAGHPDPNVYHPPLGKLCIAAGMEITWGLERLLGATPGRAVAWRAANVVAGLCTIALTWQFALALFGERRLAHLAAFFLAIDFLHVTLSRLATLDIFESLFVLLGLYCTWQYIIQAERPKHPLGWACLAFACGIAVKWSAVFGAGAGLLAILLLMEAPSWRQRALTVARTALAGLAVTLLVYAATYVPLYFASGRSLSKTWTEIAANHEKMWSFRYSAKFGQASMSAWWQWPLDFRPMWYHVVETRRPGGPYAGLQRLRPHDDRWVEAIVGFGSWWVWLLFLVFLALAVLRSVRARRDTAEWPRERAIVFLVLAYALQIVLWSVNKGYLYYMLPVTPMMCLLLAEGLDAWREQPGGAAAMGGFIVVSVGMLAIYYPLLAAIPIPTPWLHGLLFYQHGRPWWGLM